MISKKLKVSDDIHSSAGDVIADEDVASEDSSESEPSNDVPEDISASEESAASEQEEGDAKVTAGNAGWADAISKVLRTTKPKKKRTLVLSRAKKLTDLARQAAAAAKNEPMFEIDGEKQEEGEEKPAVETKPDVKGGDMKRKKIAWQKMCRVNPNILEKDRERALTRIATRGVVQLFNSVSQQQKSIESGLKAAGASIRKQEKVLHSVDKTTFLDVLMGPTRSTVVGHNVEAPKTKPDPDAKEAEGDSNSHLWKVLRDDFLVGGKLKDWDRNSNNVGKSNSDVPNADESSEEELGDNDSMDTD
ncbi:hypothetical protein B566_EDAN006569 [Ephemera danica]|nr:hypothetical protein B566_EDAN006569 [Ephemera danica]